MKALIYTGPETLAFQDSPEPAVAAGDVLINVAHVGICGSDMHAWHGHDDRRPAPLILGHEAAGTTADGRRVTVNSLVTCGMCADCVSGRDNLCASKQIISMPPREGASAERLAMPERNLVTIPDAIPTEKAALAEPLACGWHAVRMGKRTLQKPLAEARCLAIGGGAIGLGAALALAAAGAKDIWLAEPHAERRASAAKSGDFRTYDPTSAAGPIAPDLIIDGVGIEPTRAAASANVRLGGVIVHISLGSATGGLDIRRMTLQEITLIGTYTYTMQDFRDTAAAIYDGRLGALNWHEIRPLSDGACAFEDLNAGRAAAPKIILVP
jgi:L-gulonate 5-dehydrogenase